MTRSPTSHDVARLAGVSQSTVSLVFRGASAGRVSAKTVEKVLAAARELRFTPNASARALRSGRSGLILVTVPDLTNPFYARLAVGVERAAERFRYGVLFASAGAANDVGARYRADGALLCSLDWDPQSLPLPMPTVYVDATAPRGWASVVMDIASAANEVITLLNDKGHRRVLHLAGSPDTSTFAVRREAFDAAYADFGIARRRVSVDLGVDQAEAAVRDLLPDRSFTAIVCDDDILAAGVYRAMRDAGLEVPDDVSVTGLGNVLIPGLLTPALTTVDFPGEVVGEHAVELLMDLLDGDDGYRRTVSVPTTLVLGGSVERAVPSRALRAVKHPTGQRSPESSAT